MSRKKLRKALKDPNTVHQVRLRDGRVVDWQRRQPALLHLAQRCRSG